MPLYAKVRLRIDPTGRQTSYGAGLIDPSVLEEEIQDERRNYSTYPMVVAVEDAGRSVVATFSNGTVRITQYR